jgi:hypothetical protein
MTLQLVLLFAFQVLHGYVYARVSLIITARDSSMSSSLAIGLSRTVLLSGQPADDNSRLV